MGDAWLSDCPGSASRFPDWLVPIITTASAIGQYLATGLQIGTLGELGKLSEGREEPRVTRAHTRRKRAPPPAHAYIRARTHAHARTHARAYAYARGLCYIVGAILPAICLFFYIGAWCDDAGEIPMVFGGVN